MDLGAGQEVVPEGPCGRSDAHGRVTYVDPSGTELPLVTQWLPWAAQATPLLLEEPLPAELKSQIMAVDAASALLRCSGLRPAACTSLARGLKAPACSSRSKS